MYREIKKKKIDLDFFPVVAKIISNSPSRMLMQMGKFTLQFLCVGPIQFAEFACMTISEILLTSHLLTAKEVGRYGCQ